jgi:hypothetical protein
MVFAYQATGEFYFVRLRLTMMPKIAGILLGFLSVQALAAPLCRTVLFRPADRSCGEHCGYTSEFNLGDWSGDEAYSPMVVQSLQKNNIVKLYKMYSPAGDMPAYLVSINPLNKKTETIELPLSLGQAAIDKSLDSKNFLAMIGNRTNDYGAEKVLKVYDKKSKTLNEISLTNFQVGPLPFTWRSATNRNEFFYFSAVTGKIETWQFSRPILGATAKETQIIVQLEGGDGERLIFESEALFNKPGYQPVTTRNWQDQSIFLGAHVGKKIYALSDVVEGQAEVKIYRPELPELKVKLGAVSNIKGEISKGGDYFLLQYYSSSQNFVKVIAIRTGEPAFERTFSSTINDVQFAGDGQSLFLNYRESTDNKLESFDFLTRQSLVVSEGEMLQKLEPLPYASSPKVYVISGSRSVFMSGRNILIDFKDGSATHISAHREYEFDAQTATLSRAYAMGGDYRVIRSIHLGRSRPSVRTLAPPASPAGHLKAAFTKGALSKAVFAEHASAFFSSGEYKSDAALTARLVLWMGGQAPVALTKYLNLYKDLPELISQAEFSLKTEEQKNAAFSDAQKYIANTLSKDFRSLPLALSALKPYFKEYPDKSQTTADLVHLAEQHLQKHSMSAPFDSIDAGVNVNLLVQSMRRTLGIKFRTYTDIAVDENGNVVAYGTEAIEGGVTNEFGLSGKVLGRTSTAPEQTFTWNFQGREQRATVRQENIVIEGSLRPATQDSPNYQELRPNGKLGGIVGVSANLGTFARDLGFNYQGYFEARGFTFSVMPFRQGSEALNYLLERIRSGEIGYFIRDGHAENRGEYAVSITPNMEIAKGVNRETNEVVYILLPGLRNASMPVYNPGLTFSDLGAALRARPNANAQFLYFETKCWGIRIAGNIMRKVAAPGTTVVGPTDMADTFEDSPQSGVFHAVEGLRASRLFSDWNSPLAETPFLFPNSPDYFTQIGTFDGFVPTRIQIDRTLNVSENNE